MKLPVLSSEDFESSSCDLSKPFSSASSEKTMRNNNNGRGKFRKTKPEVPCVSYTKFKYQESQHFEFKQSIVSNLFQKYLETLCGFLNTGEGGYLIFGIRDNLDMIGLSLPSQEMDRLICRFDSIISTGQILQQIITPTPSNSNIVKDDTTILVKHLSPMALRITRYVNHQQQQFLVIQACPTPGTRYQCANGMIYYRLGASNYFEKVEKLYRQSEYDAALQQITRRANTENHQNIRLFEQTLRIRNETIHQLQEDQEKLLQSRQQMEELMNIYQIHLKQAIAKATIRTSLDRSLSVKFQTTLQEWVHYFLPCFVEEV